MGYDLVGFTNGATPSINGTNLTKFDTAIKAAHHGTHIYGASAAGNDTYAVAFSPTFKAYNAGMSINLMADVANSGAATLNVDGLGAKAIKKLTPIGKLDIESDDIIVNGIYTLIYDGTDFILLNPTIPSDVGLIEYFTTKTAPSGRLAADGTEKSRTTYALLFNFLCPEISITSIDVSANTFTKVGHKLNVGDPVRFSGTLPTGLSASTTYYVISSGFTADVFKVSTGVGGSEVDISSTYANVKLRSFPFGVGDGSATFNLPDGRGVVPKGWDNGKGYDADRVFGSYQTDGNKTHVHPGTTGNENATHGHTANTDPIQRNTSGSHQYGGTYLMPNTNAGYDAEHPVAYMTTGTESATHGHPFTTDASGNTEVTVKNVAWLCTIRYK